MPVLKKAVGTKGAAQEEPSDHDLAAEAEALGAQLTAGVNKGEKSGARAELLHLLKVRIRPNPKAKCSFYEFKLSLSLHAFPCCHLSTKASHVVGPTGRAHWVCSPTTAPACFQQRRLSWS
jgi:hypothetical protein